MADGGAAADAAQALSGLSVKFTEGRGGSATWRLGCDAKRIGDKDWSPEHDSALLNALRALEALQGLPAGPRARDAAAWQRAQTELRFVRSELAAPAHKPERVREHKCSPGYDCVGCKQVRPRLPTAGCAATTLETLLHVPPRALLVARCGRITAPRAGPRPTSAASSKRVCPTGSCAGQGCGAGGLVSASPERVVLKLTASHLAFPRCSASTNGRLSRLRFGCACARTSCRSCACLRVTRRFRRGTSGAARSVCPRATWAPASRTARRASRRAGRAPARCRAGLRRRAGVRRRRLRPEGTTRRLRRRGAPPRTRP